MSFGLAFNNYIKSTRRVRVRRTADQALGAQVPVTWTVVDFDTASFFNAGTPTFLTIPITGLYFVVVWLPSRTVTPYELRCYRNVFATGTIFDYFPGVGNPNAASAASASMLFEFTAGDQVAIASPNAITYGNSAGFRPMLSIASTS
ncbi:MAG TPA: hypothetical protein VJ521_04265 [Acidobacteriota bacterium]|nr:hypothetical protein [Acidobacteriota bacterium]